jgi:hypothetical protein
MGMGFANGGGDPGNIKWIDDEDYWKDVYALYSNVLNASGLNNKDPIMANITKFNKHGRRFADPPYVGRSYIFFTRPDLNFSGTSKDSGHWNVRTVDLFNYFSQLEVGKSVFPFLMYPDGYPCKGVGHENIKDKYERNIIGGKIIDPQYNIFTPFIPMFSNCCKDSGGGKDILLEVFESEGDYSGNRYQFATGADDAFTVGETSVNFMDLYGSPIFLTIYMWVMYIHLLTKGVVLTRKEYVKYRIIDYTCSIYVFLTDLDGETIIRWAKYTGCFPKNVPMGVIKHSMESNNMEELRDLSISFAYNRYEPMRPQVFQDFNKIIYPCFDQILGDKSGSGFSNPKGNEATRAKSPEPLVVPEVDLEALVAREAQYGGGYITPTTDYNNDGSTVRRPLNKDDYDSKFWGRCPFIVDNKLLWF